MPQPHLRRAFVALWWTVGFVLLYLSLRTVRSAISDDLSGDDRHEIIHGSIEAIAAVLFLVPRAMRAGGLILLATLGVAFLLHALQGHFTAPLLVYAAAVLFVTVHGPIRARAD